MNIRKLFCPDNTPRILLFLFFFVISVITTIACGYTEKNATGNVLLLFLLLLLAHRNTLTSITALLFLFCCALYAPAGMTYGKINNSFIVALLQTTADEAAEFTGMIPVYHFLVSAAILVFMVIFWRTHHRGHRNWLALLLFVLCSVNSWPLRMVKGTVVGTTDTLREMQRYEQLSQHRADSWKILPGAPLYDTIVIVTGESVRRDYMSVYGYPVPTTPWLNTAPGLFIDGYTSAAASTVPSLSRTLIYDYEQNPDSGNNVVALAAKAGYSTWWISNQGKLGEHDTRISVIASDAEHTVFLKKGSFASRKTDDMLLLQETERALADKSSPKVIFLHMIGSHPNPCDRLNSWPNHYLEQYPRKIACYLASISKLDNFLGQLDGILRRHSRHFAGIFQWLTDIRTENIPPFNPLTDEDNEPVMVFNGERNVPADSLKPQPLILPVRGK
ncbi:phosphoethanolamine transferase [Escherichia coli]|nr:phosphoethanolamine transferase [Escherichia coli]